MPWFLNEHLGTPFTHMPANTRVVMLPEGEGALAIHTTRA
jgi:hypothetical protein